MKKPASKKQPSQIGYWTIEALEDGGFTVAHGFGATRPTYACNSLKQVVDYIWKRIWVM